MKFESVSLHPTFCAEIKGVNLDQADAADIGKLKAALDRHGVLILRHQRLSAERQLELTRTFGPVDGTAVGPRPDVTPEGRKVGYGEISNLDEKGEIWKAGSRYRQFLLANNIWHSDTSYKAIPSKATFLYASEVPPIGGETEFADMRAAWDDLPESRKRELESLTVAHNLFYSRSLVGMTDFTNEERARFPAVAKPLVRVHEGSQRNSLYLSNHASHIIGWPFDKGRALLDELIGYATQPKYVYQHRWSVGELAIWDNGCTMHRGRPFDEFKHRRVLHRTSTMELKATIREGVTA